jgi:hypothetical protein
VEVPVAEAIRLVPGRLHLCSVGVLRFWAISAATTRRAQAWMRHGE